MHAAVFIDLDQLLHCGTDSESLRYQTWCGWGLRSLAGRCFVAYGNLCRLSLFVVVYTLLLSIRALVFSHVSLRGKYPVRIGHLIQIHWHGNGWSTHGRTRVR